MALIGYTNAGKSTLFNRLTGAGVLSKVLFATLDPTMRAVTLPPAGRSCLPIRSGSSASFRPSL